MASQRSSGKASSSGRSGGSRGGGKGKSGAKNRRRSSIGPGTKLVLYLLTVLMGTGAGVAAYWNYGRRTPVRVASDPKPTVSASRRPDGEGETRRPSRRPTRETEPPDDTPRIRVRPATPGGEPQTENPDLEPPPLNAPAANGPATPAANAPAANGPAANAPVTPSAQPLPPTEIRKGMSARPEVALTFDAGSDWKPVRKILETLAAERVHSTFFLTGEWVSKNPRSSKRIAAEGHELGNHSWDHPAFTKLSDADIQDQLRRTEAIIQETTGQSSHPFFRPPLGDRNPRVLRAVGDAGYLSIYWTLDSRDSVDKGITAAQIRERVLAGAKPGSIVLLHCGSQATADALPEILTGLRAKGLTPVPVSRLLEK